MDWSGKPATPPAPSSETNASDTPPLLAPAVLVSIPTLIAVEAAAPGANPVNVPVPLASPLCDFTDPSSDAAPAVAVLLMSSV